MAMTRKDYELIARVIARRRLSDYRGTVDAIAQDMATALHAANPAFDMGRFLKACAQTPDP